MSDALDQVQDDSQGQLDTQTEAPEVETEGGNPNWDTLRSKLDPVTFKLIEPELQKFDQSARTRIESVNKAYEPYKRFAEQEVTPDVIEASLNLYGQINSKPEEVFTVLQEFLVKEGRLPETQKEVKEAVALHEDAEDDTEQKPATPTQVNDPRLDRAMSYIEQQEQRELDQQAEQALAAEIAAVKQTHPEYTKDDEKVIAQLALAGLANNPNYKYADAAAQYEQTRERLLKTPRPGDLAPDLVSPTGGIPAASSDGKSWGSRSKEEVQDVVADLIARSNKK
jgi:hypothetical protein